MSSEERRRTRTELVLGVDFRGELAVEGVGDDQEVGEEEAHGALLLFHVHVRTGILFHEEEETCTYLRSLREGLQRMKSLPRACWMLSLRLVSISPFMAWSH